MQSSGRVRGSSGQFGAVWGKVWGGVWAEFLGGVFGQSFWAEFLGGVWAEFREHPATKMCNRRSGLMIVVFK